MQHARPASARRIRRAWVIMVAGLVVNQAPAAEPPPPWAYGFKEVATDRPPLAAAAVANPNTQAAPRAPDPTLHRLPGSDARFTRAQISNRYGPADWYPQDHPPMPDIVAHGKESANVMACALCHYPNGKGRPENAGIAGLPVEYFIEQMQHFRNGNRKTADGRKANTATMAAIAKGLTDEEIRQAAEYYAKIAYTPWITVKEVNTVPQTTISVGMFLPLEGGGTEALGTRILEVPQDVEAVEILRSPRVGFIAYAPRGSIAKGKALVMGGAGKTVACGTCHGADLRGVANIPAIAGRSPSYMVRQMVDMKMGTRKGAMVALMQPVVANLTNDDLVAISAYVASLAP